MKDAKSVSTNKQIVFKHKTRSNMIMLNNEIASNLLTTSTLWTAPIVSRNEIQGIV